MTVVDLAAHRERNRAAAEAVFEAIEREVVAARDAIMARALSRLAKADPLATLDPVVSRLGRVWVGAWPFAVEGE